MSEELFLTLGSVFSYLKAAAENRCVVEGEELLNSNHIILIGTTNVSPVEIDVLALCLQTSSIQSRPHEIRGKLDIVQGKLHISEFKCSCKAGLSGICKHVAAVLLKCARSPISSLEKLSSTDISCYWSNKRKRVAEEYEAKPILETTCFQTLVAGKKGSLTSEQEETCFKLLTSVCKESSLSIHLKGRSSALPIEKEQDIPNILKTILMCAANSEFLRGLDIKHDSFCLKPCCRQFVSNILSSTSYEVAANSAQRSDIWNQERQYRITGSRCYSIFTFTRGDWEVKAKNYFWPKKFSNKYVEHGLKYEREALAKYKLVNNYDVYEVGLVISKQLPWLAYSPDGIVISDGFPTRLVEVKCPYDGIDNDAINFVHTCPYLQLSSDDGLRLKKKHQYYGQVQLGMALLNLKICDFLIYSAKSKSFLNIVVPFDEQFAKEMICSISEKYFKFMLHVICERKAI